MQQVMHEDVSGSVRQGKLAAQRIADGLVWGVGSIQPQGASADGQQALVTAVLVCIEDVTADEKPYSTCTDGRVPVKLLDGEQPVPVREQNVGADTMLLFHMAEALGPRFYEDPDAPLQQRISKVAEFMRDNGLQPSAHLSCGAAANYVAINKNLLDFTSDPRFVARQKALLPEGAYDKNLRQILDQGYRARLQKGAYDDWRDKYVMEAVEQVSGKRAIAQLNDDGRGIHGHVEEQIIRVKIDGVAINEAKVASSTNGREVFGVNDLRMERLARMIGRGKDEDYQLALMAGEDFTDGAHGTLAKNLPTFIVSAT